MKKIKTLTVIAIAVIAFITKAEAQKKPPPPPPPSVAVVENNDPHVKVDLFLKNNPTVADIYWEKKDLMVVKLKNGNIEKYNVANSSEKRSFVDKYGDVPAFPPPPPPPPPKKEAI